MSSFEEKVLSNCKRGGVGWGSILWLGVGTGETKLAAFVSGSQARTDVDATTGGSKSGTLKFVRTLSNISKDEGGVAHMRCEAVGDPPPIKIRWYKNEAPLEEKRPKITIRKIHAQAHEHAAKNVAGSRLKITNLDVSDVGFYSCRVTNGKDQIQSEGTLRVDSTQKWQGK
ncbi:tyrosine-protein kinase transmembrane receptor Ror isoform X1 [Vespula maculifrons]|uniref:Tyrosine-protein kinase transmembrane receptor Ror isoform X1 n=1 Tax=Vespula maculifrons TaxID=7453 RepID=A0ABD2CFB8_VESMC